MGVEGMSEGLRQAQLRARETGTGTSGAALSECDSDW